MDVELELDKMMNKLTKKQRAIVIALFEELFFLKEENDELIDMFVTERCFGGIKDKVESKYKRRCATKKSNAPTAEEPLKTTDILENTIIAS